MLDGASGELLRPEPVERPPPELAEASKTLISLRGRGPSARRACKRVPTCVDADQLNLTVVAVCYYYLTNRPHQRDHFMKST